MVADAPQDYCPAGNTKDQPSVAYKQMYAPRWGGHVRQASFYNGYTRDIFSQYPPSDEMNRFWERLLALPPKQGLPEWGPSYYARWALASGRWTLIESSPCEGCPQPQVRAPQYQAPAIVVQRPASPPPPVYYQPAAAPPVIYQTASPAPATAHAPKPRATYSNPACVKRLEEWGYSGRDGIKEFQRKLDIRVDGVAGPETCRYVRQILANCESKERCDP
ncbi:MAG: hypothetical protein Q7R92_03335 [bacterium]|nr:hypothetical protein [bacterium]